MRTGRSLISMPEFASGRGVCSRGVSALGGCLLLGGVSAAGVCSRGGGVCSWGVSTPGGCLLLGGVGLLRRCLLLGASAPRGGLLWRGLLRWVGGVCSRGCGISACTEADTPLLWTESQMPVKTLPWPNFVAAGKN